MRRLLALAVVAAAVWGVLRRRFARSTSSPPEPSPADELRSRLAESRAAEDAPAAARAAPAEAAPPPAGDGLEDRRRDVHERARQSMDELA